MINNSFFILILTVIVFCSSCSRGIKIHEYSDKLQINFPENMDLLYYKEHSDLQDYSVHSVYKVSFNQKNILLEEITKDICKSEQEKKALYSCWYRCGDYFSFEYNNEEEGVFIEVDLISKNNMSLLNIYEIKI